MGESHNIGVCVRKGVGNTTETAREWKYLNLFSGDGRAQVTPENQVITGTTDWTDRALQTATDGQPRGRRSAGADSCWGTEETQIHIDQWLRTRWEAQVDKLLLGLKQDTG